MDKMKFESPDMVAKNIERIGALFPNCVAGNAGWVAQHSGTQGL